ncbi:leucine aminopeptidase [Rhizophagus irregularis DAOM 181602=DAOM 197198]|uniref:Leucine aminopeptidase n=2 Tax=Rhizophagus irregularis TaxID=588596 RepID=A0A2P4QMJ8_RHIID|nr:leucine aminopeptidase [Rhizophagus irregularis DAOM 181602=DAOM 197198]POG78873.1 leucine aminopeptidase [Rhizophagus irregularis DAOM 181602=DAOM 197198]|eukprot:XP_025185739.1 leucine aminopeptidase [Rhizophagus irregularis DAOM 181602=DAOM 197198]
MSNNLSSFDALVLGVYKDGSFSETASKKITEKIRQTIKQQLQCAGVKGKLGEVRVLYGIGSEEGLPSQIAVVGLGTKPENERDSLEKARAAVGVRTLRNQGAKNIAIDVMTNEHGASEGATLALFKPDRLKSAQNQIPSVKISPFGTLSSSDLTWETGLIYANAQNFARTLGNSPANHMTPTIFTENAKSVLKDLPNIEVIVRDRDWVEGKKMGSFLSVANGSDEPLKFLEIHYRGGKDGDKPLALVGKGITFDSGGISLKFPAGMSEMKIDMGGGAAVTAALYGIAKLELPINVVVTVPLCENLPSGHATKPGDVVVAMNGKSIEVDNTDAEGRLILADALYYTSSTFQPHSLIDLATLTGAIGVALGIGKYAGIYTNSDKLWEQLAEAGKIANDPLWRMPLDDFYLKSMTKSDVADYINSSGNKYGSSCKAAIFLKEFVYGLSDEGTIRYAHIDMACIMNASEDSYYNVKGATGRPARSIIEFARKLSRVR